MPRAAACLGEANSLNSTALVQYTMVNHEERTALSANIAIATGYRGLMKTLLIKNALVLATMDDAGRELKGGDVYIEGPEIKKVGRNLKVKADAVIDAKNCVVLPGIAVTGGPPSGNASGLTGLPLSSPSA